MIFHSTTACFSWLLGCEGSGATFHSLRRPACHFQALLSIKLCKECGSNPCVRVFILPWGHVGFHDHIWAYVTSMGSPDLNARFWLVETNFAALWLATTYCSHYDYYWWTMRSRFGREHQAHNVWWGDLRTTWKGSTEITYAWRGQLLSVNKSLYVNYKNKTQGK